MMNYRNRTTETAVYVWLWLIAISLFLLGAMKGRAQVSESLIDVSVFMAMVHRMLPLLILFLIHNNVLIPKFFLQNKWKSYFGLTALAIVVLWVYQYIDFMYVFNTMPHEARPGAHPMPRPLIPLPVLLDFTYALLVIGCNLAITLMFKWFEDKLEKESLMKANAENQLAYLKAQINPHFYMNMLNNIHGMIEIDPEKAQKMLIDMSHLMRHMLYDSSNPAVPLKKEIEFMNNYLNLMRQRYPEDKVIIKSDFPSPESIKDISLPPLLFLVFIENAFKHGVSYREISYISVSMEIADDHLKFCCMNSVHDNRDMSVNGNTSGIGLKNVRQRLQLLYGENAELELDNTQSNYVVNLTVPLKRL